MTSPSITETIRIKRDGGELSRDQIDAFVRGCVEKRWPDYQIAALLMAIALRGMSDSETVALTAALRDSGETVSFEHLDVLPVDKHSTGGVGDKVSLVLAPLVASAGVPVPMVSGRSLGHTGGTLDKLESIPNFQVHLTTEQFRKQVEKIGVAIVGQTEDLVPADRILYALRDVTATIESVPLIVASILSKKFAEGARGLVLDVKTGSGAFMAREEEAVALAEALVRTSAGMERSAVAYLTDMNQPLGQAVGNSLEVMEVFDLLNGEGPEDVKELCLTLGAEMLRLAGQCDSADEGRQGLEARLGSGAALEKMQELLEAQGGDPAIVENYQRFIPASHKGEWRAEEDGFIAGFDTRRIGQAATVLGAGRMAREDEVDPSVGLQMQRKIGDEVRRGDAIGVLYYRDEESFHRALEALNQCVEYSSVQPRIPTLVRRCVR